MTKAQIVKELQSRGEAWASESYSKAQLESYLNGAKEAESMTADELIAKIRSRKEGA